MRIIKQKKKVRMKKVPVASKVPHLPVAKASYHKSGTSGRTHYSGPRLRGPKGAGQYGVHPFEKLLRIPT